MTDSNPSTSLQIPPFRFFLWLSNIPLYIYFIFFIHSSVYRHLGCFHILAIVNNTVINMGVHITLWDNDSIFNFLRNHHTIFDSGVPVYISTNSVQGFPLLHILTNICYLVFLIINILTNEKWHIVVLICVSLRISDAEQLFMYLLAICVTSLKNCLCRSFAHFFFKFIFGYVGSSLLCMGFL